MRSPRACTYCAPNNAEGKGEKRGRWAGGAGGEVGKVRRGARGKREGVSASEREVRDGGGRRASRHATSRDVTRRRASDPRAGRVVREEGRRARTTRRRGTGGRGTHATMRLRSFSSVKCPTTLCVTLVGLCACARPGEGVGRRRGVRSERGGSAIASPRRGKGREEGGGCEGPRARAHRHHVVVRPESRRHGGCAGQDARARSLGPTQASKEGGGARARVDGRARRQRDEIFAREVPCLMGVSGRPISPRLGAEVLADYQPHPKPARAFRAASRPGIARPRVARRDERSGDSGRPSHESR